MSECYCDECAKKHNRPYEGTKTKARCQICGEETDCTVIRSALERNGRINGQLRTNTIELTGKSKRRARELSASKK